MMSLSLGGPVVIPGATNNGASSISQALDIAVESGIVTVVAIVAMEPIATAPSLSRTMQRIKAAQ